MVLFGARTSRQKVASLIPVVAGVGFAYVIFLYITNDRHPHKTHRIALMAIITAPRLG